jgi:hypothetical protein
MSQDVIPPLVGRLYDDSRPYSHADAIFAQLVLPTNTTCTLPNAAVAPNISIILALVKIAKHIEKRSESPIIATNRSNRLWTKYNVKMDAVGRREAMILITCAFLSILESG